MLRRISQFLVSGLAAILPLVATIAVFVWLGGMAESFFGGLIKFIWSDEAYWPGLGLLLGLGLVLAAGLLVQLVFFRKLLEFAENMLDRIPLIKTVYGGVRDLMQFASPEQKSQFSKVVLVRWQDDSPQLIGFVTREDFADLEQLDVAQDTVAVYVPMSYQIGGFMLLLDRERVTPIDMPMEKAMRLAVTAGMSASSGKEK